jgi:hypothetical protein
VGERRGTLTRRHWKSEVVAPRFRRLAALGRHSRGGQSGDVA